MPQGKVKWFSAKKGYGFIREEEKDRDIFLHVSELENSKLRVLKEACQCKQQWRMEMVLWSLCLV